MHRIILLDMLLCVNGVGVTKENKMKVFKSDGWSVELPEEWQQETDNNLYTFYHPNGVGALQVSGFTKDGAVTESDLKELASEHIDAGAITKPIESSSVMGMTLAFGLNDEFWQYWYIGIGNKALLVTYNCDEQDKEKEINTIKVIVSSIKGT